MLINKLMAMFFDLLGADFQDIENVLLDEGPVGQQAAMGKQGPDQPLNGGTPPDMTSNQQGLPVSSPESMARM
jgi:hypothetical protein